MHTVLGSRSAELKFVRINVDGKPFVIPKYRLHRHILAARYLGLVRLCNGDNVLCESEFGTKISSNGSKRKTSPVMRTAAKQCSSNESTASALIIVTEPRTSEVLAAQEVRNTCGWMELSDDSASGRHY